MQTGLQWRKGTEGLRADGLLLGLWLGDALVCAEYWLLRGGDLAMSVLRGFFTRPLRLSVAAGFLAFAALAIGVHSRTTSARHNIAAIDEESILAAAALYRAEEGRWPARLEALVPNRLRHLRLDPWGRNYSIFRGEGGFAVVSAGADGEIGTNDDVVRVVSNNKSGLKGQ